MGAWIEIKLTQRSVRMLMLVPYTGAWIDDVLVAPRMVRGLKYHDVCLTRFNSHVAPRDKGVWIAK